MRQKARIRWFELGDRNTSFFFSTLKLRHNKNVISSLTCEGGAVLTNPVEVRVEVMRYFSSLFSTMRRQASLNEEMLMKVIRASVSMSQTESLMVQVSPRRSGQLCLS